MSAEDEAVRRRRLGQRLACEVLSAAEAHPERFVVLVTATREGAGCSTVVDSIARELVDMSQRAIHRVSAAELEQRGPQSFEGIVLVDGPPLRDARGGLVRVPHSWVDAMSAALVVVMARQTATAELAELEDWLQGRRIAPLGAVWNEHRSPTIADRLKRLLGRVFPARAASAAQKVNEVKDHG